MIEDLKSRDIKDVNVLNAMLEVPRHFSLTLLSYSLLMKIMLFQ